MTFAPALVLLELSGSSGPSHRVPVHPSYVGLRAASRSASAVGQANVSSSTVPERLLFRALYGAGLRFRRNATGVVGKPDVVIKRRGIAVFCDGNFWHGHNWRSRKEKLGRGSNAAYWVAKIAANRRRDARVNRELRTSGWLVIRVWESSVRKNPDQVARRVMRIIKRSGR